MKRLTAIILLAACVVMLCSCGASSSRSDGEISVFYYTYSDTYVSSVRATMDKLLNESGKKFNNYDANGNQTTQTEQIATALAKGSQLLIVNVVDTGSDDAAQNIVNQAKAKGIPVIFFNRSVSEEVIKGYDKCIYVGTDYEMAGHLQGEMIGKYILENYDSIDLNGDGEISYVMFKGQEGNLEAIARTKYAADDCNEILISEGKIPLKFYDKHNTQKYLVDQNGLWSSAAATDYMSTILAQYSEANGNMVELVIANNDEMALGAIAGLQASGYNNGKGKSIPVFGVDATDAAKEAIENGTMVGTVKQDAEGMAKAIIQIGENLMGEKNPLDKIEHDSIVGEWRVNIPYSTYVGE